MQGRVDGIFKRCINNSTVFVLCCQTSSWTYLCLFAHSLKQDEAVGKGQSLEIKISKSTDKLKYPPNQLILTYCFSLIGVPVSSRVSTKIQQLLNTLKRPKRPPLKEFFVDDSEEIVEGSSNSTKNIHSINNCYTITHVRYCSI